MNSHKHSERLNSTPQDLWQMWTDVSRWNMWDPEVEGAQLEGLFKQGAKITIKYKNGSTSKFTVLLCDMGQSYILSTTLALGVEMLIKRFWEKDSQGMVMTQEVTLIGPMAPVFLRMRRDSLHKNMPTGMQNLKGLLEEGRQQQAKESHLGNFSGAQGNHSF